MKKNRIRNLSVIAAFSIAMTGMYTTPCSSKAAELTGQSAQDITSQMTIGWNLGNTLDCSNTGLSASANPEKFVTKWGNPVPTKELFETVQNAGFNTVRIPITWYEHLEYDEASQMYIINDTWMDFVKQTVDYAYDLGMFVIINVHHEDWVNVSVFTEDTYAEAENKLRDIWSQVAETFAEYDQHLIFESMNEPRQTDNPDVAEWGNGSEDDGYTWEYLNNLNAVFVDTVRSQGSEANQERVLMLPGYCASSDFTAIRAIEIPENAGNVALSVHAYAPYYFTMGSDSYANHAFPGKSGWGEDYESALTNLFNGLQTISEEKNAPIIIGEFGASNFDNTDSRVAWATDYLTKAKNAGIPCILWDNNNITNTDGEAHGYLYRKTNTWYDVSAPVIEAMMAVYGITPELPAYEPYIAPEFSWDTIPVTDDWIALYRVDSGRVYQAWGNGSVSTWREYVNENYDIVMVYASASEPLLVLQNGTSWNYIYSSGESDSIFMAVFTYQDFLDSMENAGENLEDMTKFYISASSEEMTFYGVFAVPKSIAGDLNADGVVSVLDIVMLQKYLLGAEQFTESVWKSADRNQDTLVNIYDLLLLKKTILQQS